MKQTLDERWKYKHHLVLVRSLTLNTWAWSKVDKHVSECSLYTQILWILIQNESTDAFAIRKANANASVLQIANVDVCADEDADTNKTAIKDSISSESCVNMSEIFLSWNLVQLQQKIDVWSRFWYGDRWDTHLSTLMSAPKKFDLLRFDDWWDRPSALQEHAGRVKIIGASMSVLEGDRLSAI